MPFRAHRAARPSLLYFLHGDAQALRDWHIPPPVSLPCATYVKRLDLMFSRCAGVLPIPRTSIVEASDIHSTSGALMTEGCAPAAPDGEKAAECHAESAVPPWGTGAETAGGPVV